MTFYFKNIYKRVKKKNINKVNLCTYKLDKKGKVYTSFSP